MFEVRRGCENLRELKKADFKEVSDETWNFRCIKKVCKIFWNRPYLLHLIFLLGHIWARQKSQERLVITMGSYFQNWQFLVYSGTNRNETGVIPFLQITENFNPGEIFAEYLRYIPECGTLTGKPGGFLFPMVRESCKGFDVHNKNTMVLFQPNMPGISKSYFSQFATFFSSWKERNLPHVACFMPGCWEAQVYKPPNKV